ncbi:MAG TPA: winged helix DNA-binding domain-containing protein [Chloroflexi bacterium]|nr:winged helix DNA-binding domain-containing protein [Chloroflexota bacterium]HHW88998.1 winged helix DNA-binding domain-containing protein [Chloroflexota bacterium]
MPTTSLVIDLEQVRWFRLRRSGLIVPFATPENVAQVLFGVQAQIHPAAGVAIFNRTTGFNYARYEQLLFDDRSLVKLWGQRGTLHVYATTDWPLVCAMLADRKSWWGRTAERTDTLDVYTELVTRSEALLRARGMMGRSDLRASGLVTNEEHLSPWGGVFSDLVRLGYACHAARDGEGIFAHRTFWRPDLAWELPDAEAANLEVLRRYLRAYGPATQQDFAYWRGGKVESTRRWLAAIADELATVTVNGVEMVLLREDVDDLLAPAEALQRTVRMLYRFDPLLLAHKDKRWIVPTAHHQQVFRIAGHIEGVILEGGVAVATWRYIRKTGGLFITLTPFKRLSQRVRRAVEKQALQLAHFFGLPLAEVNA